MNDDRSQLSRREDDASFDALLARAEWPELSAEARARLQAAIAVPDAWRAAVPAAAAPEVPRQRHGVTPSIDSPRTLRRTLLAVAAALAVGILGVGVMRATRSAAPGNEVVRTVAPIALRRPPPSPTATHVVPSPSRPGRPANFYERAVVASARIEATRAVARPASITPPPADDIAELRRAAAAPGSRDAALGRLATRDDPRSVDLVLQLVADPRTRAAMLVALRRSTPRPSTDLLADRLIVRLADPKVADRFAAAKALGTLNDAATLSRLARMAQANDHRREALAALLSSDAPGARATLDRLVRTDPNIAPHVAAVRGELRTLYS